MLWNLALHIGAGLLATNAFTLNMEGAILSGGLAAILQGIDAIRIHRHIREQSSHMYPYTAVSVFSDRTYLFKLAQVYLIKVVFYGGVTLVAAYAGRAFGL